jgi:hypothetical protein
MHLNDAKFHKVILQHPVAHCSLIKKYINDIPSYTPIKFVQNLLRYTMSLLNLFKRLVMYM